MIHVCLFEFEPLNLNLRHKLLSNSSQFNLLNCEHDTQGKGADLQY